MRADLACLPMRRRVGLGRQSQRSHLAIWAYGLENSGRIF